MWRKGHMSHNHMNDPSLNCKKRNSSDFRKPTTPYKAIMPPVNQAGNAIQKVCAIMMGLNDEELQKVKVTFIESLDMMNQLMKKKNQIFSEKASKDVSTFQRSQNSLSKPPEFEVHKQPI